ncbi:MAG: hypothetical protein K2N12_09340 [Helicobacter sp.]|nr:hypothetical protein [Helicobacter sp.]
MRFYKRKMFYVPLLLFLPSIIIASALLYKPIKLIYWVAVEYPKEERILAKYDTLIDDPSVFLDNFTTFQPRLKDFQALNKQIQTAKQDFILMEIIGMGEFYIDVISNSVKKFIYLSKIKRTFFSYPEMKRLNQSQMQQFQEILKNSQEIKEAISEEQFQFAQAYEDFYQYISNNTTDLVYIQQANKNRYITNSAVIASSTYFDHTCSIPYKYIETLLSRTLESYNILKNLKPNEDVLRYINQNSYEEFIASLTSSIVYIEYILTAKGMIDACQQ